jgi:hypothetical protein
MAGIAAAATLALPASSVDLADDAGAARNVPAARVFDDPHELVAEGPLEAGVALGDLEVGVADAGERHADDGLALGGGVSSARERELRVLYP